MDNVLATANDVGSAYRFSLIRGGLLLLALDRTVFEICLDLKPKKPELLLTAGAPSSTCALRDLRSIHHRKTELASAAIAIQSEVSMRLPRAFAPGMCPKTQRNGYADERT